MNEGLDFNNLLSTWKQIAVQYNITWQNSFLQWELPSNVSADFALTLALPIAHKTKKNPREIAQEIIKSPGCSNLEWEITERGYINFRFSASYYQHFLNETLIKEGQNLQGKKKNIQINLEYVSANPTGYLHLAHFRHAFVGNSLANVYQFLGYQVTREYYINDRGGQITSLIHSIYLLYCQEWLEDAYEKMKGSKPEYVLSKASREIAERLREEWGKEYLQKKLEGEIFNTWKREILKLILAKIKQDLEKCGVKFDVWFSETSLYEENKHQDLVKRLEEKNLIFDLAGAKFLRSSLGGDDKDRVIIKQDKDYTYFFSDILYHQEKAKRANKLINIWGADHHGTIARLKSAWKLLGYEPERLQIILVQTVSLFTKEGQTTRFSKREGNTIELGEALQYMDMDQLKFFLLEKEPNQPLSINTELLKENKEKTRLYYIQYAHARCHQIFRKAQEKGMAEISSNIDLLKQAGERKIFKLLVQFPFILESVVAETKLHHLIYYLYELARTWQVYYQNNTILESNSPALTSQKLLLVKNIQLILKLGLNLMGITAPERM
jgi:arginyl-tRNA synthetase